MQVLPTNPWDIPSFEYIPEIELTSQDSSVKNISQIICYNDPSVLAVDFNDHGFHAVIESTFPSCPHFATIELKSDVRPQVCNLKLKYYITHLRGTPRICSVMQRRLIPFRKGSLFFATFQKANFSGDGVVPGEKDIFRGDGVEAAFYHSPVVFSIMRTMTWARPR